MVLEGDTLHVFLGREISHDITAFDEDLGEVFLHEQRLVTLGQIRLQGHLDDLRLTIGVSREISHT